MNVLKQKEFWMGFVLQAVLLFGVLFWGSDDVLDMTFIQASIPLAAWARAFWIGISVAPFFLIQILTAYLAPQMKRWKFWVLVISSFFWGFGLAEILAHRITIKYLPKISGIGRQVIRIVTTLLLWWAFWQLIPIFVLPATTLFVSFFK